MSDCETEKKKEKKKKVWNTLRQSKGESLGRPPCADLHGAEKKKGIHVPTSMFPTEGEAECPSLRPSSPKRGRREEPHLLFLRPISPAPTEEKKGDPHLFHPRLADLKGEEEGWKVDLWPPSQEAEEERKKSVIQTSRGAGS